MSFTLNDPYDDERCNICLTDTPENLARITCAHRERFCEKCVELWLESGRDTCPLCRAIWPKEDKLEKANREFVKFFRELSAARFRSPVDQLLDDVFVCHFLPLLLSLIIYPS